MRKLIASGVYLATLLGVAISMVLPARGAIKYKSDYVNPTGDEFPILAYHAFINPELYTESNFKLLRDCGFNIANSWTPDTAYASTALKIADKLGMKVLVNLPQTRKPDLIPDLVSRYKVYPSTIGFLLWDEPIVKQFGLMNELIRAVTDHSHLLAYVNVLPNYASLTTIGAPSYRSYLEQFIADTHPQFLSYDFYCIINKDNELKLRDGYFENLEDVRSVTQTAAIPMWTFCLSTAHFDYPVPTEGQLLFEAFTALSYGSKAIQYYGYQTEAIGTDHLTTAPVDSLGTPRKVWHVIKKVNRQIQTVGKLLLDCESKNVWHTGAELPAGTRALRQNELPGPFTSIVSGSKGVVVGHLTDGTHNYLLIVNKDFERSQKVRVGKQGEVKRIYQDGKALVDRASQTTLKPGAWCLYTW